jgi:hypothetical protein
VAWGKAEDQINAGLIVTIPLGRMGSHYEVAKAASLLACGDSSFITGLELFVDGSVAQI